MSTTAFGHLHVHSEYSLLDGACRIPDLVAQAAQLEMPGLALTDHGAMYGAIDFYQECEKAGIKPLIGCEIYTTHGSRTDKTPSGNGAGNLDHLVLLAESETGYRNLMRVVSSAHLEGFYYRPRADMELLAAHSEGLVALTACLQGTVAQRILKGDMVGARQYVEQLREIYGKDSVYLELMDHGIEEQGPVNAGKLQLAAEIGVKTVATNDCHYVNAEDAKIQDILLCIQTGKTLNDPNRMRFANDRFYLKSAEEMLQTFSHCPEAVTNCGEVIDRCNLKLELDKLLLPHYEVPPGETIDSHLRVVCEQSIPTLYGENPPPEVAARLAYELDVIRQCNYSGYFLIVADFIWEAKKRGIRVGPGRGSATGSIVTYLLGISEVDPLRYGLIFERMLNPERVSPPDIDLDFPDDRREEIIEYCRQKYGRDHVAQVITFNTMGAKAAIRDVGRVLDVDLARINALAKAFPGDAKNLGQACETSGDFKQMIEQDPELKEVVDSAARLEGISRHVSVHAAAVVISDAPLTDRVPLREEKTGAIITQYAMDPVVAAGLVKMDFLGLKTLTAIDETIQTIKRLHGFDLNIHEIPLDDSTTYELLSRGDTAAVFQLESDGMRSLLRQLRPNCFEHMIALVALYRPGPMQSSGEFCAGRHGAEVKYLHPRLESCLKETYGVILYQEQVMQLATELAGFSMPQAEIIMRAMSKKDAEKMAQMKSQFFEGCTQNGIPEEVSRQIFERMETFSRYGFNKSHSAAYGLIAYWTAYLKANYPAEYMAAHITTEMDSTEKVAKYVLECGRMNLRVRPPSVNASDVGFTVHEGEVVFGLAAIKSFGYNSARLIVQERNADGPFTSLRDFCKRMLPHGLAKSHLQTLILAGALSELGERNALLAGLEATFAAAQKEAADRARGQNALFDDEAEIDSDTSGGELPDVPPMGDDEALQCEKEYLGLFVSDHPLLRAQEKLEKCSTAMVEDLPRYRENAVLLVGGMLSETKLHRTRSGSEMMFATLAGVSGEVEITVFPRTYEKYREALVKEALVVIEGKVEVDTRQAGENGNGDADEEEGGGAEGEKRVVKLICNRVTPLERARTASEKRRAEAQAARLEDKEWEPQPSTTQPVRVEVDLECVRPDTLPRLAQVLRKHPGPCPVVVEFKGESCRRCVRLGETTCVNARAALADEIRQIEGIAMCRI